MSCILTSTLQPSSDLLCSKLGKHKPSFNYGLEGLRGLAALWVGYAHVANFENQLDPAYHPSTNPLSFLHSAHAAVLIFFVLSGYVIGLTNTSNFSWIRVKQYLLRRIVRLFPIYVVAILLSSFFSPADSIKTILGNLIFLQNIAVPVLSGNVILWTLNYEVVYYLIFIFVWRYRPKTIPLLIVSCSLGLIGWLMPSFPSVVSGYAAGWVFWLAGLWLAWRIPEGKQVQKIPLVSYFCILAATDHFSTGKIILNGLGFPNAEHTIVNISDLILLPICLLLIACITNRYFSKIKWIEKISFLLPICNVIMLLIFGRLFENTSWTMASAYVLAALLCYKFTPRVNWLEKLSYIGSISYGIYILHMPIMHLIHDYFPFSGSPFTFYLRALLWFTLVIGLSHLLERWMQPQIKSWSKTHILS